MWFQLICGPLGMYSLTGEVCNKFEFPFLWSVLLKVSTSIFTSFSMVEGCGTGGLGQSLNLC